MADGSGLETFSNHANSTTTATQPSVAAEGQTQAQRDAALKRALVFISIAAASAGLAYAIVRATLTRAPIDPTTERIQQLIDEANRLLKQLDEKKPD
jgi:hypothetical protein